MAEKAEKKEKLAVAGRISPEVNKYYGKISKRYMAAGIVAMILLVLYIIGVIVFCSDYITYENLSYLVRDFGTAADESSRNFDKIVYNGGPDTEFAYFRGGVAVCGTDFYRYYDKNGIQILYDTPNFSDPTLVASDKYLLIYDMGGTGYAVYNQLTKIIEKNAEEKIIAADISTDGSLVLVTRSHDTKFVVELYNAAFNRTMVSYKDSYVLGAAISADGEQFLVASAVPSSTDFDCEIEICKRGESDPITKDTYTHTMPLAARATDNGFLVLCDTAVYYYNEYGILTSSTPITGMTLKYADIQDGRIAAVGQVNALGSENRLLVLDETGEVLCDEVLHYRFTGVRAGRNLEDAIAYLCTSDTVIRVKPDGSTESVQAESADLVDVVPLTNGALICTKTSAYQIFD